MPISGLDLIKNHYNLDIFTQEIQLMLCFFLQRWSVNLILRTMEKMFYLDTPFDSEDLVEVIRNFVLFSNS